MSIVSDELQDIRNHCKDHVAGSQIITCVPSMVQVCIEKTKYKKLTACIQFPVDYPHSCLLIELKSKTLSEKFLSGLVKVCEKECQKILGKPQVLKVLKFLSQFLDENPLFVCSDEIAAIKRMLDDKDELRLKQKASAVTINICKDDYFLKLSVNVPENYPEQQIIIEMKDTNFPRNFQRWFIGQATEIARQQVQKPLKPKPRDPPFAPKPSLLPSLKFLVEEVKRFPNEICQLCQEKCFPENPSDCICDERDEKHIEKVYCGHLFHNRCLDRYMKTPPFSGGKKCPSCKQRIFHDKWKVTPKLAEERWAHHEAKKRELGEVVEFFE